MRRYVLAAALIAITVCSPARAVELELVLAVDASTSVDYREFNLQMAGYAAAFRHRDFIDAVEASALDGIAVCMILWAGPGQSKVAIDWSIVRDGPTATDFAETIDLSPRVIWGGSTAIGDSLAHALELIAGNDIDGRRRVIDVSGDGRANDGVSLDNERVRAAALGVTINGLTILNEEPDLDRYYANNVIVGATAFVEVAATFDDFADAILRKLIREVRGAPVASEQPTSRFAFGYASPSELATIRTN